MDWFPLYNSIRIALISTFIIFFTLLGQLQFSALAIISENNSFLINSIKCLLKFEAFSLVLFPRIFFQQQFHN